MNEYVLIKWPKSQSIMDFDWFEKESFLASEHLGKVGQQAYFIPKERYLEINNSEAINDSEVSIPKKIDNYLKDLLM
jgi:hypothetical protein